MEYLLSSLLLALNLLKYQFVFNKYVFLLAGIALFFGLFFVCFKKTENFLATCIMMLCHTWTFSWINIFGDSTSVLQLPWFYVVGVLILGYFLLNLKKTVKREVNSVLLITVSVLLILLIYPLLLSRSMSEGIKEFLVIYFFLGLVFCALLMSDEVPHEKREYIVNAFIFACTSTGALLIFQSLMFSLFSVRLFKLSTGYYFGSGVTSVRLLMEDSSSATVILGCGVIYLLERIENRKTTAKIPYIMCAVSILVGMGLTTRRTSVLTLLIVLVLYALFHYKGALVKTAMVVVCFGFGAIAVWYLTTSRSITTLEQLLFENGRFSTYIESLKVAIENPFGIGYDNSYLISLVGGVAPHNTVIRWLVMCGAPSAILFVFVILKILITAYKKKLSGEFWTIFYTFLASNFIPDILTARFFVIMCISALMIAPMNETNKNLLKDRI